MEQSRREQRESVVHVTSHPGRSVVLGLLLLLDIRLATLRIGTRDVRKEVTETDVVTLVVSGHLRDLSHETIFSPTLEMIWYAPDGDVIYQGSVEIDLEPGCNGIGPDELCMGTFELEREFEVEVGHRYELSSLRDSRFKLDFKAGDRPLIFEFNPVGSLRIVDSRVEFNRITP